MDHWLYHWYAACFLPFCSVVFSGLSSYLASSYSSASSADAGVLGFLFLIQARFLIGRVLRNCPLTSSILVHILSHLVCKSCTKLLTPYSSLRLVALNHHLYASSLIPYRKRTAALIQGCVHEFALAIQNCHQQYSRYH